MGISRISKTYQVYNASHSKRCTDFPIFINTNSQYTLLNCIRYS